MLSIQTIHASQSHLGWDNSIQPAVVVEPGDRLSLEIVDASGGQLSAGSRADALTTLDFARVNPVTGPVYIDGAQPGDAVAVHLEAFEPSAGWGWTGIIPGFGLLADDFTRPELHVWTYDGFADTIMYGDWAQVALRPFAGTIGLAPSEPGSHSVIPPRRVGGNMDTRDLCAGSTLFLPVEVPGGLFSIGDGHAAQGDGEVCGTAIECAMVATLRLDVVKAANLPAPVFETPGAPRHAGPDERYLVTTGIGPDLMGGARDAVRSMIDQLERRSGMPAEAAYMLCSVAADIRVTEIVDMPNWVVACYLALSVLGE